MGAADARACREGYTPSRSNSQRTNSELDFRLWITTAVLITPSWRRTGKMASLMDGLAPTTGRGVVDIGDRGLPTRSHGKMRKVIRSRSRRGSTQENDSDIPQEWRGV